MVFLEQVEADFQNSIDEINVSMMEVLTTFLESFHEVSYVTEKSGDTLIVKIKKFFSDLIASFQNFKSSIKIEVSKKLRDAAFKKELRVLYDEAKKKDGPRKFEVVDFDTIMQVLRIDYKKVFTESDILEFINNELNK